jgi:DNA-binding NtrC family response regulator/HAMP domain-containing protein
MLLRSLKSKLLIGVSVLVICSGVLISSLVTHRYSRSLFEALSTQAQYLATAVSLQAADMVLINDLVALQKMLDHQLRSNPSLSYLFIIKSTQVLAHTFPSGIPVELISANQTAPGGSTPHLQEIASTTGEYHLDIAVPIFEGKAGTLRLGFSEKPYREQLQKLWMQMALSTLGILLFSLGGSLYFIRRITGPVTELARAANRVDQGELDVRVGVQGQDEVAALATSFNSMVTGLQTYTQKLEEQTLEIERAHQQTRTFCGIVQEIGALSTLKEIGRCLINRFRPIVECRQMALLVRNDAQDGVYIVTESQAIDLREPEPVQSICTALEGLEKQEKPNPPGDFRLMAPLLAEVFQLATLHTAIPFLHEKRLFGALLVACTGECRCNPEETGLVAMMLNQAAGVIRRAMLHEEEIRDLHNRIPAPTEFCGMISKNPKMQSIFKFIEDIAPTDATVLIQGESGTGKELVARAIHRKSLRHNKPFIVIDCSAYPATLLESELFGHEKGAFTGAIRQKSGRFEQADGGTVFLDEIGEIPPQAQIKLLRVLQTHKFERLGGEQTLSVNVRVIAATNRNLLDEVKRGRFREDLYYRLNVIPVHLPPLKERRNDIPVLARHFLHRFALGQGKKLEGFSPEAMRLLLDYPWPGNVRELENTIEHAAVLVKGTRVEPVQFPSALHTFVASPALSKAPTMTDHEMKLLRVTMEECGWNKKEAAKRLGISRSTLYEKLKKHHISRPTTH